MKAEQLYNKLKIGAINKSQLSTNEIADVYKYMLETKKITKSDLKPAVVEKYGLAEKTTEVKPLYPFDKTIKFEDNRNVIKPENTTTFDNYDGYYTETNNNTPTVKPSFKLPSFNLPQFNPPKPANSEMELADLLSSYSFSDRGMPTQNYINDDRGMPINQNISDNLNLSQRIGYGLSSIGKNYASGNLNAIATVSEAGNKMLQNITGYNMPDDKRLEIANKLGIPSTLQAMKDSDSLAQSAAKDTQKGKQGLGTVGSTVYDILQGAGQMSADIGTAVTLGTTLMPVLGTRVFGQAAGEARQKGANLGQQIAYGTLSAGLEMATEKLIGGLPLAESLGMGGVADDALQNAAINLAKIIKGSPRVAKGFVYLANMLGEGAEEAISEVFTPILQRMTYDPNANLASWEEILYSALLGSGISAVMGGGVVGNPEVDFNISESYNPTDKVEFNPQDFNTNIPYQDKPRYYTKANNIQETLDIGLNQLYSALDIRVDEQAIDKMINNLEQVKQFIPELSNYVDTQIDKLNSYTNEPFKQPITDENELIDVLVNNDTNIAQNSNKDVIDDITTQQDNVLQEVDNNVTETQQIEPATPIVEDTINNEMQTVSNMPTDNAIEQPTTQPTEQTEDTNVTEDKRQEAIDKFANKMFDSYLLNNKIDRNTLSNEQINNAINERKKLGQELVDAINNKDFDVLTDRLHRGNLQSLKLFTDITGLPTNTQKATDESIRSLDQTAYYEWANKKSEERKKVEEQRKAEEQKAKDEEKQNKLKDLENRRISTPYGTIKLKDFAERLKADGYRYAETNNYGGFELNNGEKRIDSKKIENKEERQYLRDYFRDLAKEEQQQDNNQDQEEYEALSDDDKEVIDSLFTKGGTKAKNEPTIDKYNGFKVNDRVRFNDRNGKELTGTIKRFDDYSQMLGLGIVASVDVDQVATFAGGVPIGRIETVSINNLKPYDNIVNNNDIIEVEGDVNNGENELSIDKTRTNVQEPPTNIPTEDVQEPTGDRGTRKTPLSETGGTEGVRNGTNGTGNDTRTELGNGDVGDNVNTSGEGTGKQRTENKPRDVQVTSNPKGNDYVINSQEDSTIDSDKKTRYNNNVEAIRLARLIESESRHATPDEQKILSKYVGWGGLSEAFATEFYWNNETKKHEKAPKKGWEKEHAELKELLEEEEYRLANETVTDAFYTPIDTIKAMYEGLKHFGFNGGRIIEPALGIGNFVGSMPSEIKNNSTVITGIEVDETSGKIAKLLYPNSDIRIQGFEKAKLPTGYYDVAISNVPFGKKQINDKSYPNKITNSIHNYFFAKTLDVVKPGGIVMFITSSSTMDSKDSSGIRAYIKSKADFIGALRLPNTTFKDNVSTEVTSDIIVLRVRKPGEVYNGEQFLELGATEAKDNNNYTTTVQINEYFTKYPENMLGELSSNYRYGKPTAFLKGDGRDLKQGITNALSKMKGDIYEETQTKEELKDRTEKAEKEASKNTKEGSYEVVDGKLTINKDGKLVEVNKELNKTDLDKITKLIEIKNTARDLNNAQRENQSELTIDTLRKKLNRLYDAFVKKNGFINNKTNAKLLYDDPDVGFLLSLEVYTKPQKANKKLGYAEVKEAAIKNDIFTKNTTTTIKKVLSTETSKEALIVSLNEKGKIDIDLMSKLTDKTPADVIKELAGYIYKNPITQEYETRDIYLSGNVKHKLKEAEARAIIEPEYKANVEALKIVQPKDKEAWQISMKLGSTLINPDVHIEFTKHLLGSYSDIEVYQTQHSGEWHVREKDKPRYRSVKGSVENTNKWGINRTGFTAIDLLEKIMNNKSIIVNKTVTDENGNKKKVNLPEETALAQERAELIRQEFDKWIEKHNNGETLKNVVQYYNDNFNTDVLREFDGSHLPDVLDGMNPNAYPNFKLTKHQKDAIWRIISGGGNTLLAHEVGAGKTFSMVAAAMEMKRLGIINKPMFVVPNSIYEQWGLEFRRLYTGAKILIPSAEDFTTKNRHILMNRIATGTYDAVIIPESQFTMISMSEETVTRFYNEKIEELELALDIARAEGEKLSESKITMKIKNFRTKLEKKVDSIRKDVGIISFEELGVDSLFVDEAHRFKNLMYQTSLQVSGLGKPDGSDKSFDLLMKVRYLQRLNGGRGITFATATPVLNSLAEVYNWQQYLAPEQLRAKNIYSFDAWASIFAKIESVAEVKPEGVGYRVKNGISKISNVGMLAKMFREFTDFKTQEMLKLPRPDVKGGKYQTVSVPKTAWLENYMAELAERAETVRNGRVKPEQDNMLNITTDGRKAALDPRLVDDTFTKSNGVMTKIDVSVNHLYEQWEKTKEDKLTHLVFVEFSTPKAKKDTKKGEDENFDEEFDETADTSLDSFYQDIKRQLVAKGIPEKEIAFIHDAKNSDQKVALKNRFNSGEIRILIGNNEKMGVGIDLQKRTKTITHIDFPWRPKDLQQEDGRGLRQGNINKEIETFVIIQEGSFDARLWDNLQRKAKLVDDVLTADLDAVEIEDVGLNVLSAQEVVGIASGNPLMQEQIIVSQEVTKLRSLEKAYKKENSDNQKGLAFEQQLLSNSEEKLKMLETLKSKVKISETFNIEINGKKFDSYKEADKYITQLKNDYRQEIKEGRLKFKANFAGIIKEIEFTPHFSSQEATFTVRTNFLTDYDYSFNTSETEILESKIKNINGDIEAEKVTILRRKESIEEYSEAIEAAKEFPHAEKLKTLTLREQELMRILNPEQVLSVAVEEETDNTEDTKTKGTKGYKGGQSFIGQTIKSLINTTGELKKPTEIRDEITKLFGVPTSSTKFNRSKKYLGYYKVIPEVIRLRYDNQIGTVMHELGHHFDKKYNFSKLNNQLINDMINKMNPEFKANYQKSELPGEAIAEFLRYYTSDPNTAQQFAGDFYELFEQTLDPKDLKNIQAIRSDVLRWVNAERSDKRKSTIVPLSKKENLGERVSEVIDFEKYNTILFDKYAAIQKFVKTIKKLTGRKLTESLNPYVLVERTYKNNSVIEGLIKGQLYDTEYNPLNINDSLQKIMDDVNKNLSQFEDYLKLKHAITLAQKGHMIYSPDIYNNIGDMQQDLQLTEQEYPEFVDLSERLYKWYDAFFKAWVVDTNMLGKNSQQAYQTMRQEYPYYVPMFRVQDNKARAKNASSSLADQMTPVDRLSEGGSDKDTVSPIDSIVSQVSRMVNAYSKNNVMRAIVKNYNTVDGLGGFIDRVPPDVEKQIMSTQSIKDMIDYDFKTNANAQLIDNIINAIPDMIENYKTLTVSKDQEIVGVIAEDGSRQFYQVFDKAFLDSLTNMNQVQLDATVKLIASIRRTTTALTTGLNPIFSIASNAPRDFTTAYIFGSYKNPAEYVYEYAKAMVSVLVKTNNYKKFRDIGGVYGSSMTSELRTKNDFIRRLERYRKGNKIGLKNALSFVGEFILDFNDAIETAPRLSEFNKAYKIAKKQGKSEYDSLLSALSKADEVTLNFSRQGTVMNNFVGQSIPYLNAGLQGVDKLRRGLTGEERTQVLIKSLTMLTLPTILLWLAHRDDEDYEKLSDGIKDNYWILWKKDDGSFWRIPKPKDLSVIFSSNFERALNAYFEEQGIGAFEGFGTTVANSLLPPTSTIISPLFNVASNKKWSGGKIVSTSLEYLPKTEQYDDTTSRIGVILAQAIGKVVPGSNFASPKNIDYLLDQYYGGLADILLPLSTPNSPSTGEFLRRKFTADPSFSNDIVNNFYDLRDKTTKANSAYKNRKVFSKDVDLIAEQRFNIYYKSISSMWKSVEYIGTLNDKELEKTNKDAFIELINASRFGDKTKQKVIDDLKDNKLNKESITLLQKAIRDEIIRLSDDAVKAYKETHEEINKSMKGQ